MKQKAIRMQTDSYFYPPTRNGLILFGMQILNREFTLSKLLKLGWATMRAGLRIIGIFKNPLQIIRHYLYATAPEEKELQLRNGRKLYLSNHPHDIITAFIIFGREDYGKIKPGATVIDIGANIGVFALYAAASGAKKVYCFEPNLESYNILSQNIAANNYSLIIFPHRLAGSDADDQIVHIPKASSPYNTVSDKKPDHQETDSVNTVNLDTFCERNKIQRIDLIKIDCEGAEFVIIPSLSENLLAKVGSIKVEYQDGDVNNIIQHLTKNGFQIEYHLIDKRMKGGMLWMTKPDKFQ